MLKPLIVSAFFPLSKHEVLYSFVFDEVLRLFERGLKTHVVTLSFGEDLIVKGMHIHKLHKIFKPSDFMSTIKNVPEFFSSAVLNPKVIGGLSVYGESIARTARTYNADILHAHFAYPEGFAAKLAKKTVTKPLVVSLHGYDIITEPSIGYGVRLRKCYDNMVRSVLRTADKVLVASKYMYKEALKAGCSINRVIHVPNGVDLVRFNDHIDSSRIRNKLGIKNKHVIFTVGGHVPVKGIEYLIQSVWLVMKKRSDVIFVIGGDGPLHHKYQALAKDLGVTRNIVFTGRIPHSEIPYYYAACNIVVVPSVIEAFGLVTVEAMACGKPVVGTNVGGTPEIIEDRINGYLVKPKYPKGIAKKIMFLLDNPDLMKTMGAEGRRIAEKKFDIKKRIDNILSIYSDLAKA